MKPQCLRIGNYISHTNDKGTFLCKITAIGLNHVEVIVKGVKGEWHLRYNEIQPAKITETTLSDFGFRTFKDPVKYYDDLIEFEMKLLISSDYCAVRASRFNEVDRSSEYIKTCYSIHDLQNVIFDNFYDIEEMLSFSDF